MNLKQLVRKAVVSGGPGGGKGAAGEVLIQLAKANELNFVLIPETATDLFNSGWRDKFNFLPLGDKQARFDFFNELQSAVLVEQYQREIQAFKELTLEGGGLIICDRSFHDSITYMGAETYEGKLTLFRKIHRDALVACFPEWQNDVEIFQAFLKIDPSAVFLMRSPAVDCAESYTLTTNEQRTETVPEAAALDALTKRAWFEAYGRSDVVVEIENYPDIKNKDLRFNTKLTCLADETARLLELKPIGMVSWPFAK